MATDVQTVISKRPTVKSINHYTGLGNQSSVTITSVDTTKSTIIKTSSAGSSTSANLEDYSIRFVNSTSVVVQGTGGVTDTTWSFTVVEYY